MTALHGASAYRNGRCRCDACKAAHNARQAAETAARVRRAAADPSVVPHGASGYQNWGCRCPVCRTAENARKAALKARAS